MEVTGRGDTTTEWMKETPAAESIFTVDFGSDDHLSGKLPLDYIKPPMAIEKLCRSCVVNYRLLVYFHDLDTYENYRYVAFFFTLYVELVSKSSSVMYHLAREGTTAPE